MTAIIPITGAVTYAITLDPTVWIFDDRRLDLTTYFTAVSKESDDEKYLRDMGAHWSREIIEGATVPPTLKTERKFDRQGMKTGTFGIIVAPFLENAKPHSEATTVIFECKDGHSHPFSIAEAKTLIFKFSQNGMPLVEGGPVHLLYGDGSNADNPITEIVAIHVQ